MDMQIITCLALSEICSMNKARIKDTHIPIFWVPTSLSHDMHVHNVYISEHKPSLYD